MSRNLSDSTREALYNAQTDACFLVLLKLDSDELASPIYVVNNTENIISVSIEYTAIGFKFILPSEEEEGVSNASIVIDNVDRTIVEAVRSVRKPLTVTANIIEASTPDTIEVGPLEFQLRNVKYNASQVSGDLYYNNYLEKNAGTIKFSNLNFPGLFD